MSNNKGLLVVGVVCVVGLFGFLAIENILQSKSHGAADSLRVADSIAMADSAQEDDPAEQEIKNFFIHPVQDTIRVVTPSDSLCRSFLQVGGMLALLDKEPAVFEKAGIEKKRALVSFRDSVQVFTKKLGDIIVMNENQRLGLSKKWSPICQDALPPKELNILIFLYTNFSTEANLLPTELSPRLREVLLKVYREDVRESMAPDGYGGFIIPVEYSGRHWFTQEELLGKK